MINERFYEKEKKILILLSILLIATLSISIIESVNAKDITIGPKTPGGLKTTIENVENGSTIYLKNGIYSGENNTNILLNKNISIEGLGSKVVIDGKGKNQIFKIPSLTTISLKKLKITNGYTGYSGGAVTSDTNTLLIITNCFFTNNKADITGAIYSLGSLDINRCSFINNKANNGGAICSLNSLTMNKCTFTKNNAKNGRGGAIYSIGNLNIKSCTFTKNNAEDKGGAICAFEKVKMNSCNFTKNSANDHGGAVYSGSDSILTINNCIFIKNTVKNQGGAVYSGFGSSLAMNLCTFTKNKADGPIYINMGNGGAICSGSANILVINICNFTNNNAKNTGGAVYSDSNSKLVLNYCKFNENRAKELIIAAPDSKGTYIRVPRTIEE